MTNLNAVIPILMHLFIFSVEKMYYLHIMTSAVSCINTNASQWEAALRDDVGFPTLYRRIYRRNFLTLSNQTSCYICKCFRIYIYRKNKRNINTEWQNTLGSYLELCKIHTVYFIHQFKINDGDRDENQWYTSVSHCRKLQSVISRSKFILTAEHII